MMLKRLNFLPVVFIGIFILGLLSFNSSTPIAQIDVEVGKTHSKKVDQSKKPHGLIEYNTDDSSLNEKIDDDDDDDSRALFFNKYFQQSGKCLSSSILPVNIFTPKNKLYILYCSLRTHLL